MRRIKESAALLAAGAGFKAGGEEMYAPQCQRALSTVWVRVVVLTRSGATESALVGCSVGAYWRDLRWRNHRSLRGKQAQQRRGHAMASHRSAVVASSPT